jgi:hypothetical protein
VEHSAQQSGFTCRLVSAGGKILAVVAVASSRGQGSKHIGYF